MRLDDNHPIVLNEIFRRAKGGYRTLQKTFAEEGITIALTAIGDMFRQNRIPKKLYKNNAFEEMIRRRFAAEIIDIGIDDIWAPYSGELTPAREFRGAPAGPA